MTVSIFFKSSSLEFYVLLCARFRKIEGDTCVNGSEKDFLPVLTACPIRGKDSITRARKKASSHIVLPLSSLSLLFID